MLEATEFFVAERMLAADKEEINHKSIRAKARFIQRRIKERFNCTFVAYREQKKETRKVQLRQWQWKAAEKGNPTMLIWLGKQYLGQTEKVEQTLQAEIKSDVTYIAEWGSTAEPASHGDG